jgi:hypothetical protein
MRHADRYGFDRCLHRGIVDVIDASIAEIRSFSASPRFSLVLLKKWSRSFDIFSVR